MINLTGKDLTGLARGVNMFKTVRRDEFKNSEDVAPLEAIEQGVDEVEAQNSSPSQKLFLSFNGKKYPVSSIEEAQDAWDKIRDAAIDQGIGNRAMDQDPLIVDSNGKRLHALSWNGSLMNTGPAIYFCPACKEPTVAVGLDQSAECSRCSYYSGDARKEKKPLVKVSDEQLREWKGEYQNNKDGKGLFRGAARYGERKNEGEKAQIVTTGGNHSPWMIADIDGRKLFGPYTSYSAAEADFRRRNLVAL